MNSAYRRKKPIDVMADTGDIGDLSATAAPVGGEGDLDSLAAMAPPSDNEPGLAALLNPAGGGAAPQGAPITNGPTFGQDLGAQVINPGDTALAAQGPDMGGYDPQQEMADQMQAALSDPSTPPDQRQQILEQLQLEARRRLAGL